MNAAGETRARGLLFDALAVLIILAVCVSLLHPVLLGGKVMSASHWWLRHGPFPQETVLQGVGGLDQFGDQMMQFVPWLKYAADAYAQDGRIPLWKTTALCGAPFVGNAQSAVWYPTNFVSIVLGAPEWMLAIGTLFKLFIGAVGAWLLARHLGISRLASLACGLAFGIGGFQAVWSLYPLGTAASLFPLLVLLADRVAQKPGWGRVGLLALVAGLQHFAGHPETTFQCQTVAFALAGVRALASRHAEGGPRALPRMLAVGGGMTLGALVGAAQIAPVLEYIVHSDALRQRAEGHGYRALATPIASLIFLVALIAAIFATRALMRGRRPWLAGIALLLSVTGGLVAGLASSLNPSYLAVLAADWFGGPRFYMGAGNYVEQNGAFLGAALAVAGAGFAFGRPRGLAITAGGALVFGLLVGSVAPVVHDLLQVLPGFHVAANTRLQLLALLAGAMLAGLGLDAIGHAATRPHARVRLAWLLGAPLIAAFCAMAIGLQAKMVHPQTAPQRPARKADVDVRILPLEISEKLTDDLLERLERIEVPPASEDDVTIAGLVYTKDDVVARLLYGRDGSVPALVMPYRLWGVQLGGPPTKPGAPRIFAARVPRAGLAPGSTRLMLMMVDRQGRYLYSAQLRTAEDIASSGPAFPLRPAVGPGADELRLLCGAAVLLVLGLHARGLVRSAVRIVLIALIFAGLVPFMQALVPALPGHLYYPSTPGLVALSRLPPQGRSFAFLHTRLPAEIPAFYGIADVIGYDALYPHRIANFLRRAAGDPEVKATIRQLPSTKQPHEGLLGLMAVQVFTWPGPPYTPRFLHPRDVPMADNPEYLPRARIVHHALVEPDDEVAMERLAEPDFPRAAVVALAEDAPGAVAPPEGLPDVAPPDPVRFESDRPDHIVLEVQPSAPGWLVLADTHFPGWKAFVDGEARPIRRANVAFRAVALRPGDRRVEFRYEPWTVRAGNIGSGVGLGVVLLAFAGGAWGLRTRIRTGSR
ncbi:MAG: hypothetical protein ACYTG2_00615 [Planctomycetota bacterium]|jgi:hypothetical protein